jgi:hypothetical protein
MSAPIMSRILVTLTFPATARRAHVPFVKLQSLAKRQLTDAEVIETIDHLFSCTRCFQNYRLVRTAYLVAS